MSIEWQSLDNDIMNIWQNESGIHLQLYKWGNEAFFNIDTPWAVPSLGNLVQVQDDLLRMDFGVGNKLELQRKNLNEPEDGFIQNEKGGVEMFIQLNARPVSNVWEFPISHQGLNFYYQSEIPPEELEEGQHQFEGAIGSYAAYHSTRGNIHHGQVDADKYKCGKAFHIHRPKITDSKQGNPNWAWVDLNIDTQNNLMTLTVPQDFLDNAIYPIIIDPNFGYETQATANYIDVEDHIRAWGAENTQGSGTGNSISACLYINNQTLKCALYDNDNPSNYIQTTDERADIPEKVKDFYTFDFSSPPSINNNTTYHLACWGNQTGGGGYGRFYYDGGEPLGETMLGLSQAYGTWPPSIARGGTSVKYSIYCTFTLSAMAFVPQIMMVI